MNSPNQPPQSSFTPLQDMQAASYWLRLIADAWGISVIVFLRRGFGKNYLDIRAAIALLIVFIYPVFWMRHDPRPMLVFLGLYIVMLLRARVEGIRRRARGVVEHSRYTGLPRLLKNFPKLDEMTIKSRVEPLFVAGCGLAFLVISPPLGVYILIAAFALAGSTASQRLYERAKAQQAIDAMIEARQHAERVQSMSVNGLF